MPLSVDLNSDLGEGYGVWRLGDDASMLDLVTSANIACGFHAGDPATIERTVGLAVDRGVRIGAQVSYADLVGFGRRRMDVPADELRADVLYQLGAIAAFCRAAGSSLAYVKPHGALYNRICDDEAQARAVVDAIRGWDAPLPLMVLPGSVAAQLADQAGIAVIAEGFADRGYTGDGRLVSRTEKDAVITDLDAVVARGVRMVTERRVAASDGSDVATPIASLCVHGDTPGAVAMAGRLRRGLLAAGVGITAPADPS